MADTQRPVGLAISGAGHRAVVFALGALLYLADSGANKRVRTIASTSAGSLMNAFLGLVQSSRSGALVAPFNEISGEDFEKYAGQLARRFSGHPLCWWMTVFLYAVCLTSWLVVTWIALPNSFSFFWQLLFIVPIALLSILGQFSGGTIWGYWLSWFYAGGIVFGFALGFLALLAGVFAEPDYAVIGALLMSASLIAVTYRGRVSELAISSSLLTGGGGKVTLSEISPAIRHVFCATELERGDCSFFCRDFFASRTLGRTEAGNLPLSTVVQASGNVPVIFPPMRVNKARLGFVGPRDAPQRGRRHVLLCDGGSGDSLGTAWYLEANQEYRDRESQLTVTADDGALPGQEEPGAASNAEAGACGEMPEQLIVIDGSGDSRDSHMVNSSLPLLRELGGLIHLPKLTCRNMHHRQLRDLRSRICLPGHERLAVTGAIASIEESPCWAMGHHSGMSNAPTDPGYPERTQVDRRIGAAARRALDMWQNGRDVDIRRSEFNEEIRTIDHRVTALKQDLWRLEKELEGLDRQSFAYRETYEEILAVKKEIIGLNTDCRRETREGWEARLKPVPIERRVKEDSAIELAVGKNSKIRANYRPLGNTATASLLWHGYLSMMVNGNIFLGLPFIDHGRTQSDFEAIAKGRVR